MKEEFLHFIWQNKLFNTKKLKTHKGDTITIRRVGEYNINSGPDFFNAQLYIGDQLWAGNVEIHLNSSDWYVHRHELDERYDNVVLHIVWDHDVPIFRSDNSEIPTLILSNFIESSLLANYKRLFSKNRKWINCESEIGNTDLITKVNWLERLYFERLEQKTALIFELLEDSKNDWEAVLFRMLFKNFGLKVNGEAFFNIARSLDFSVVRKERQDPMKLEAIFFGQAGLLKSNKEDHFYQKLREEYGFLRSKHQLSQPFNFQVQFFRLRPTNFPTIRLSQLTNLYHKHESLFSLLMEANTLEDYYTIFEGNASSYWNTHYTFDADSANRSKKITRPFVDLLLINTVIPLKFMYHKHLGKLKEEEILNLIRSLKPESNTIASRFNSLGVAAESALDTQSLLQLKKYYCEVHKCLHCKIGKAVLKN